FNRVTSEVRCVEISRRESQQNFLLLRRGGGIDALVDRRTELVSQLAIQLRRIAAGAREHFGPEGVHEDAVLIRGPHRAVTSQERGTRALLAAKSQRSVEQPGHEPLESHRHFYERAADLHGHSIDDAAADDGLADGSLRAPAWAVAEKIRNGRRQVMV